MKVWVLESGTRQEGGTVIAIYKTEKAGLAAAEARMNQEVADTARRSTSDDPCRTYFEKRPLDNGNYCWIEHYCWSYEKDDGSFGEVDGGCEYLSLIWYELQ